MRTVSQYIKEFSISLQRTQDTGYRIHDTGYRIPDTGYRIQNTVYRIQDKGYRIQDNSDFFFINIYL